MNNRLEIASVLVIDIVEEIEEQSNDTKYST